MPYVVNEIGWLQSYSRYYPGGIFWRVLICAALSAQKYTTTLATVLNTLLRLMQSQNTWIQGEDRFMQTILCEINLLATVLRQVYLLQARVNISY